MSEIGFTGTREGMTAKQMETFGEHVAEQRPSKFHHGCCLGADLDAVLIVKQVSPDTLIIGHPPTDRKLVAVRAEELSDILHDPLPYLDRNKKIVQHGEDGLIVTPKGVNPEWRSGTWSTARFARKIGRHITVITPDGFIDGDSEEGEGLVNVGG
jgi:hypothetical protein